MQNKTGDFRSVLFKELGCFADLKRKVVKTFIVFENFPIYFILHTKI